jgi:hypothetical protein
MGAYEFLFGDPNSGLNSGIDTLNAGYDKAMGVAAQGGQAGMDLARQGQATTNQGIANANSMGTAASRLGMADQFRQDANQYEQDQATQGALAAYGNDPLSSGARSSVTGALAQLARQNYGAALDRANAATNQNMGTAMQGVGLQQNDTSNLMNQNNVNTQAMSELLTGKANAVASAQSAKSDDGGLFGKINNVVGSIF